jgi:hypothetical protein
MVTLRATVQIAGERHNLVIETEASEITIPLSEDNANQVKAAFNRLVVRIKEGPFQIDLVDRGEDLFSQVAAEYITQLNREIQEVWGEMRQHGLASEAAE